MAMTETYGLTAKYKNYLFKEEEETYRKSTILVRSNWAKESVVNDYGISPLDVHVILPGANLTSDFISKYEEKYELNKLNEKINITFVGKDWKRKGLDILLEAINLMKDNVINLTIIGCDKNEIPKYLIDDRKNIKFFPFLDKFENFDDLLNIYLQTDLGILPSKYEAGGHCLREFKRLGIPTLSTDICGSAEFAGKNSILLTPNFKSYDLAKLLQEKVLDRENLNLMRHKCYKSRHDYSWDKAIPLINMYL